TEDNDIYIPKEEKSLPEKTVIAKKIKPEQFINALFPNPSLVTPNVREAYFTDGQRGMQVENDDLSLEYINPIGYNYDRIPVAELIDRSVYHINEQHGLKNKCNFTYMNNVTNKILYSDNYDIYLCYV